MLSGVSSAFDGFASRGYHASRSRDRRLPRSVRASLEQQRDSDDARRRQRHDRASNSARAGGSSQRIRYWRARRHRGAHAPFARRLPSVLSRGGGISRSRGTSADPSRVDRPWLSRSRCRVPGIFAPTRRLPEPPRRRWLRRQALDATPGLRGPRRGFQRHATRRAARTRRQGTTTADRHHEKVCFSHPARPAPPAHLAQHKRQ